MSIAVSYHDKAEKLQDFDRFATGPFDRSDWFSLLCEHVAHPLIVIGEDAHRKVALPLCETPEGLRSLANWFSFTWRPLCRNDEIADDVLAGVARELRSRTHRIVLQPVPDEDGSASRTVAAFRKAGWVVFREQCDENHVLPVEGRDFAGYWSYRPGQMRTTLKRKAGKVETQVLRTFDEAAWRDYRKVYEASWKPEEERADLLEAFARAEGEAGRIRIGIAKSGGEPVAAQFWTVENGTAYIHKLAHVEAAKPLSAGTTLSAAMFEHVIDTDKVDLVDFGTGTDAYKRDWMERVRARYRLTCLDWRQPAAWLPLAKALARRLARQSPRR
ncbi:GNAT family N-acetyltransferase [Qipengyuania sp. RANM35]|uniref:GNAT family N-acetyltransferase n=1 Tax=Qipengyuania sp. RANM35 TaxID=3068635 RepID=UPI0034DB0AB5